MGTANRVLRSVEGEGRIGLSQFCTGALALNRPTNPQVC